jgi:hypothetical protein
MNREMFKPGILLFCTVSKPVFSLFIDAKHYYEGDTSVNGFMYLPATEEKPVKVLYLEKREIDIFEKQSTWFLCVLYEEKICWMRELESLLPDTFKKITL